MLTDDERQELEELRAMRDKPLQRAFRRLEQLLEMSYHDPALSVRAFRTIAECLLLLKEEIKK